jgi:serine/threonine protein phosphatase PrpC
MGCGGSSANNPNSGGGEKVSERRRRLSIGQVDGNNIYTDVEISDEDRGVLTTLDEQNILEMIEMPDGDRKFSFGSDTDKELSKKASFAEKKMNQMGAPVDPNKTGIGFACRKGLKPESPNQDSWVVLKMGDWSIYGVFDGHGKAGHHVSQFVKESLPKLIVKDQRFRSDDQDGMCAMLMDVYKRTQTMVATATRMNKIDAHMSGCTTTVLIHDHVKNKLYVSWAGDSGAGLCCSKEGGGDKMTSNKLTWDHKPEVREEKVRIEKAGGRVVFDGYANHRVYAKTGRYPGLNMSRALGDLMGHTDAGISAEPSVMVHNLTSKDKILMLCSDGVWEFISDEEAVDIVAKYPKEKAMAAADKLAKEAWDRWIREEGGMVVDDITAVIIYL